MSVTAIQAVSNVLNGYSADPNIKAEGPEFKDFLSQAIEDTEETATNSEAYSDAILMGELNSLHEATIEMREAELAINLTVQIRNRVVDAYNEVMRMQI